MNPAQRVLEDIAQQQVRDRGMIRMAVHKYRQPGGSTWAAARGYHIASLQPNISSVVIAHDDETSGHIFGINKLFYDSMTPDMRPLARYYSKEELVFENPDARTRTRWPGLRSRISFMTAKNVHAGTGHTIHALHLSECAKYPKAKEVWTSLFPSVPPMPGTMVILESTAHIGGHWFREFCDVAKAGKDGWAFVFLPWSLSPEYTVEVRNGEMDDLNDEERHLQEKYGLSLGQLAWRRARIREAGNDAVAVKLFTQEFPLEADEAWIDLDMGVFDARALFELGKGVCAPIRVCHITNGASGPTVYDTPDGELSVWEEPQLGELYDIGVDPASGLETGDWSVAQVMKRRNKEQVAEWRAKIGAIDLAPPLYALGRWYNTAQLGVEVNSIGMTTNTELNRMGYPYIYIWRRYGKVVAKLTTDSGWVTSYGSKQLLVTAMRHHVARREVVIHSAILHNEMREFAIRQTEQREFYEGSGKHDDAVTAFMIALKIGLDEELMMPTPSQEPVKPKIFQEPGLRDDFWSVPQDQPMVQLAEQLKGWK
jgi:hypothetical protein